MAKVRFIRNRRRGTTRIVRDTYSNTRGSWFQHSRTLKAFDGYCLECKTPADKTPEGYLVCHHIVPLSKGGTTNRGNLITLCNRCHKKRHKHLK